jgi:hypothetical protein
VNPGQGVTASFDLVADPDAASKVYKIPVSYAYTDPSNVNYTKQNYISIMVGDTPELTSYLDSSTIYKEGTTGEVIVKFVNKGLNQIKFLYAKLMPTDDYDVLSPTSVYVGKIDSDDYETVSYKLYVKKGVKDHIDLPLTLEYKDVNNNDYSQNATLSLRIYSTDEAVKVGLESKSNLVPVLVILVLAVGGYITYRKFRKRK